MRAFGGLYANDFCLPKEVLAVIGDALSKDCDQTLAAIEAIWASMEEKHETVRHGEKHQLVLSTTSDGLNVITFNPHSGGKASVVIGFRVQPNFTILAVLSRFATYDDLPPLGSAYRPFEAVEGEDGYSVRVTARYYDDWNLVSPGCALDLRHRQHQIALRQEMP